MALPRYGELGGRACDDGIDRGRTCTTWHRGLLGVLVGDISSFLMRMSSSMRWRSGVTPGVDGIMVLLLSMNEADCLVRQHRRTARATSHHSLVEGGYRGLVLWPEAASSESSVRWARYDLDVVSPSVVTTNSHR
jgi:hypothetical protein